MRNVLAGRYALVRQVGAGRHCVVFEALDLKLQRAVAIKLVAPGAVAVPGVAARLEAEGRIAATLAHPHVGVVTDIDRLENGLPFLVLELLLGETLAGRLQRLAVLPQAEALDIGEQLLAGLGAAHERGIVHRDVKPANIFLIDIGLGRTVVKLIDFGIAQMADVLHAVPVPVTEAGYVVGTPAYMSPEQVRGQRDLDARSDVYAAAVVLFEMLTGTRPFGERSPAKLLEAIAFEPLPPFVSVAPDVSPVVARAIDLALSKQRERRYADANLFRHALRAHASPASTGTTKILVRPTSDSSIDVAVESEER